jgi:glycosyltransferase involved in cell wall biosynthesis
MKKADVSVIIPAFGAAGSIPRALASIAAQTEKPQEVIVVVDGPDDGTLEAVEAMRESMQGITLKAIAQEHAGAGAARNRGLAEARGTYVGFLDADDEWLSDKLERSMAVISENDHVLVAHDFQRIEADGTTHRVECARRFGDARDPFTGLYRQGFIGTSSVVVRRDAVNTAGGFDETLATAQDFDLWLKILGAPGASFTVFPEVLTRYHVSPGSISTFTGRRLACTLRIAERHFFRLMDRPGSALASLGFRVLAVHYEAASAYRRAGRTLAAIGTALAVPGQLLKSAMNTPGSLQPAPAGLKAFFWLWVIFVFAAYSYRFQHLGQAAIKMMTRL